jgi:hypothetical protein
LHRDEAWLLTDAQLLTVARRHVAHVHARIRPLLQCVEQALEHCTPHQKGSEIMTDIEFLQTVAAELKETQATLAADQEALLHARRVIRAALENLKSRCARLTSLMTSLEKALEKIPL